ncbi:MAG: hypothetical protein J5I59_06845 [Saprospiraceae bacterium]|nr:hypothetical protein [Saprospiraceae bacterium]
MFLGVAQHKGILIPLHRLSHSTHIFGINILAESPELVSGLDEAVML